MHLNLDPKDFGPPRSPRVTVVARRQGRGGRARSTASRARPAPWVDDLDDVRARAAESGAARTADVLRAGLRGAMPDDAVLVNELTQVGYVVDGRVPGARTPQLHLPRLPRHAGLRLPHRARRPVGNPDRAVVSISGDGGFGYGMSEMATAAPRHPLVGVVFYDGAYGNVQRMHKAQFDGDHYGTELRNPDMVKLADAFGMAGYLAESPEHLGTMLRRAIDARKPALIGVPIGVTPDPWAIITAR